MMKHAKSATVKNLLSVLLAGAGLALAGGASAVGLGVGANANVGVQAQSGAGAAATGGAQIGGSADAQMSSEGSLNQNNQTQPESTRGLDRAQERMSPMGMENQMATEQEATSKQSVKSKKGEKSSSKKKGDTTSTTPTQ